MKTKNEINNRIKELEKEYNFCFHAPSLKIISKQIELLKWVRS